MTPQGIPPDGGPMTSPRRARSKAGPAPAAELEPGDRLLLEIGPAPRQARRPGWALEETRLGVLWRVHRERLLAPVAGLLRRPWAFLRFDVPGAVRLPGPTRDALVARGTIHPDDAALQDATAATEGDADHDR